MRYKVLLCFSFLIRRVDDLPKMRSAKLVVPTLIAKWVQTIHLSANANRTMSAIRCKDVDVNVKHLETALSLRNANVSNACPSVGRMVIYFSLVV